LVSARQAEVEPEEVKAEVVLEAKAPEVEQEVESVDVTEDIAQADEPNEVVVEPEVVAEPEVASDVEGETEKSETEANTETDQFAPRNDPSRLSVNEKVLLQRKVYQAPMVYILDGHYVRSYRKMFERNILWD